MHRHAGPLGKETGQLNPPSYPPQTGFFKEIAPVPQRALRPTRQAVTGGITCPLARRILGLALAATLGAAALPAAAMDAGNPPNANKVISSMSGTASTGPLEHPVSTQDGTRR